MGSRLIELVSSRSGNVAMMFAILVVPLLAAGGIALDMVRANEARERVAGAADAALLAAGRAKLNNSSISDEKASGIARQQFDRNIADGIPIDVSGFVFTHNENADRFRLEVSANIETTLIKIIGWKKMDVGLNVEAKLAPPRDLEVAMALDNTYSMVGAKLSALKDAANALVNVIMVDGKDNVSVGVVPFSQYVNVGMPNRDQPWLDVADDYSVTTTTPNVCTTTYPNRTETNCVVTPRTCTGYRDGVEVSWSCPLRTCDVTLGEPVTTCADRVSTATYKWRGCVGSRSHPYNVKDENFDLQPVPGLLNTNCTTPITPLTKTKTKVKSAISSMAVEGDQTYIPSGLVWAYRVLSKTEPFSEGIDYDEMRRKGAVKAIVLMSDGVNTRSPQYPYHTRAGGADADQIMSEICVAAKADGIRIFTIAFEVTDVGIRDKLQRCASSPDDFFNASDSAALTESFEKIGLSLTQLALSK